MLLVVEDSTTYPLSGQVPLMNPHYNSTRPGRFMGKQWRPLTKILSPINEEMHVEVA